MEKETLYDTFPKSSLAVLPLIRFEGPICVVHSVDKMNHALDLLSGEKMVGIDTETRPSFRKGVSWRVGLLQVATRRQAFLFRLNSIGLPKPLIDFLQSPDCTKVGLSLDDDIRALKRRYAKLNPQAMVDLQQMVGDFGVKDQSLRRLTANFLHHNLSKRQQLSNWNAPKLTMPQQVYAATDAWICLKIYDKMQQLAQSQNFILQQTEPAADDSSTEQNTQSDS